MNTPAVSSRPATDAVLVTGAAGFAGRHLLHLLVREPAPREERSGAYGAPASDELGGVQGSPPLKLVAWHRPGGRTGPSSARARWMAIDLLDRNSVAHALGEIQPVEIYHCAGAAHVGDSWNAVTSTLASNVLATHHLLGALRDLGLASRVLIPGSAMVYRQSAEALDEDAPIGPTSPYGISKLAQEQLGLRAWAEEHREVVLTRSFNHIGPGQDPSFSASGFARQIALIEAGLAEPVLQVGNLDPRRDLTDVRDTVRAYRLLMKHGRPGVVYNVCSGRAYPIREMLNQLLALSQVPISVRVDPARYRPNDAPVILGRPDRLRRETAWEPARSLPQTLADILEYWRQELRHGSPVAR
ncbi:MAG: GDP-mannose 4,6-dehydratase [Acidobacteria bacterium]|nr:GDP-mannose 4,6-dehydratase [Acidobacteriota bacterium]